MSMNRLFCLALAGATYLGLATPATAHDLSYQPAYSLAMVGQTRVPGAHRTTANVLYVVPVVPVVRGIRAAPVGQPVIYVIEQPDEQKRGARNRGRGSDISMVVESEFDGGPLILTIE